MKTILDSQIFVINPASKARFNIACLIGGDFSSWLPVVSVFEFKQRRLPLLTKEVRPRPAIGYLRNSRSWLLKVFGNLADRLSVHVSRAYFSDVLLRVMGGITPLSNHVFNIRLGVTKKQVLWVYALGVVTSMKNPAALWDAAMFAKVNHAVSKLLLMKSEVSNPDHPIPVIVGLCGPLPAPVWKGGLNNFRPESMVQHMESMVGYPSYVKEVCYR